MSQAETATTISDRFADQEAVNNALNNAAQAASRRHALAGRKIPHWENGQVVWRESEIAESQIVSKDS